MGVLARLLQHLVRHVHPDNRAARADSSRCKKAVESSAGTGIKNGLAPLQRCNCQGISTAKAEIRSLRGRLPIVQPSNLKYPHTWNYGTRRRSNTILLELSRHNAVALPREWFLMAIRRAL